LSFDPALLKLCRAGGRLLLSLPKYQDERRNTSSFAKAMEDKQDDSFGYPSKETEDGFNERKKKMLNSQPLALSVL